TAVNRPRSGATATKMPIGSATVPPILRQRAPVFESQRARCAWPRINRQPAITNVPRPTATAFNLAFGSSNGSGDQDSESCDAITRGRPRASTPTATTRDRVAATLRSSTAVPAPGNAGGFSTEDHDDAPGARRKRSEPLALETPTRIVPSAAAPQ